MTGGLVNRWRQSWNWPAVAMVARVLREPALAMPHVEVRDLRDLDFRALRRLGCVGLVLDTCNLTPTLKGRWHSMITNRLPNDASSLESRNQFN